MTIQELLLGPIDLVWSFTETLSDIIIKIIRFQILDITLNEIGSVIGFVLGVVLWVFLMEIYKDQFVEEANAGKKNAKVSWKAKKFLLCDLPISILVFILWGVFISGLVFNVALK